MRARRRAADPVAGAGACAVGRRVRAGTTGPAECRVLLSRGTHGHLTGLAGVLVRLPPGPCDGLLDGCVQHRSPSTLLPPMMTWWRVSDDNNPGIAANTCPARDAGSAVP